MYIDADCHVSVEPRGIGVDAETVIHRMDAVGVDRAVCWPMLTYTRQIAPDNAAIAEAARRHPDRIIPFGGVNPRLGIAESHDELTRCIEEYGMLGIKLNGARDGYYIDDPELSLPFVARIAEAGLVLAVHCGANDFERTHPFRIAALSDAFPELRILVIHMGGAGVPHLHDAAISYAQQYPNWYLVDSEADYRKVLTALDVLGPERICYGSDTPFCPMRYEWGIRQVIYQDLEPAARAQVLGGNAARLLGLGQA
ncbi:MAG: amidohydrolase [Anaerolineae bacterium]|nr:amidohydrolase [Anaerolineae bacterium]